MPIVITPGEPAGIGPDICLQLLASAQSMHHRSNCILIADADMMVARAQQLGIELEIDIAEDFQQASDNLHDDKLCVLHRPLTAPAVCGQLDTGNVPYVLDCLDTAIALCSDARASALVTGPIHKGIINQAGTPFSGHTEYLAAPSESEPVMMLATETLRVVLATTHLPLRDVADHIDQQLLIDKIRITDDFLRRRFRIDSPCIVVCGLNPHAGEDGHLGTEEIEIITPALESLRREGFDVIGPLPADTAFTRHFLDQADAFFTMYHDQGLPVLKYSGFGEAVNITMGLPFVRTSVDHGTALDLAGTGRADISSLLAAMNCALQLTR